MLGSLLLILKAVSPLSKAKPSNLVWPRFLCTWSLSRCNFAWILFGAIRVGLCGTAGIAIDRVGAAPQVTPTLLEQLQQRYGQVHSLEAHLVITKSSPLLLRPTTSQVDLHYDREQILWQVRQPIQQEWRFDLNHPLAHQPVGARITTMIGVLKSLVTGDIKALQAMFTVEQQDHRLVFRSRSDQAPFQSIDLILAPDLAPQMMIFVSGQSTTALTFSQLSLKP